MILTIGNIKGGVGKTTLAINIAIARALSGYEVLLVDGDEQRTALTFTDLRTEFLGKPGYKAVGLQGSSLRTQVRQLAEKYNDVIIDVGGRDTGSLRAALTILQYFLVPVQPRSFDIWAIDQVRDLIKEAKEINCLEAFSIINSADAQGRDNIEAAQILKEIDCIEFIPFMIGRRKAFPNAAAQGRSALEFVPKDVKAIDEISCLVQKIYSNK